MYLFNDNSKIYIYIYFLMRIQELCEHRPNVFMARMKGIVDKHSSCRKIENSYIFKKVKLFLHMCPCQVRHGLFPNMRTSINKKKKSIAPPAALRTSRHSLPPSIDKPYGQQARPTSPEESPVKTSGRGPACPRCSS